MDEISAEILHYSKCKHNVRSWAALRIKKRITVVAQTITDTDDTVQVWYKGDLVYSFTDLLHWWGENCEQKDPRYFNSIFYVCHNGFRSGWKVALEEEFMHTNKWSYTESSSKEMQEGCKRTGFTMKGCIAKNNSNIKCELMKQINAVGKKKASLSPWSVPKSLG